MPYQGSLLSYDPAVTIATAIVALHKPRCTFLSQFRSPKKKTYKCRECRTRCGKRGCVTRVHAGLIILESQGAERQVQHATGDRYLFSPTEEVQILDRSWVEPPVAVPQQRQPPPYPMERATL